MQKPVFSLTPFGRLSCSSIKTCWNSSHYTTLPFWTLWPNWFNLLGNFKI